MHHSTSRADGRIQNIVNREYMREEGDYCCPQTFNGALDFLDRNRDAENWLLHIENFDPHEPYNVPARFRERYKSGYEGPILDWPRYKRVGESPEQILELRANYAALVTMCDEYFGRLLDYFDRYDMWKDTALVVTTDHGFLLSEHDWWGKNRMPYYEEISHIPLMIYHPAYAQYGGQRRRSITQTIDIMPTLLQFHGIDVPSHVEGHSLLPLLAGEHKLREVALFGMFGGGTNVCDGRYAYYRYPEDMTRQELYEYTLMPTHTDGFFHMDELRGATLHHGFAFSDGAPVLKVPARRNPDNQPMGHTATWAFHDCRTVLYDLQNDPDQNAPYRDPVEEKRLEQEMIKVMRANEAPPEAFTRLGIAR
jgi:arylsulfatase A-like enzyme